MCSLEKIKQITSWTVFQNEEQIILILKRIIQLDNERMHDPSENIPLYDDLVDLRLFIKLRFLENLHCIEVIVVIFLYKHNFSETAFSEDNFSHEILDFQFLLAVIVVVDIFSLHDGWVLVRLELQGSIEIFLVV